MLLPKNALILISRSNLPVFGYLVKVQLTTDNNNGGGCREFQKRHQSTFAASASPRANGLKLSNALTDASRILKSRQGTLQAISESIAPADINVLMDAGHSLVGTQHPILPTIKQLLFSNGASLRTRGLLVELFVKITQNDWEEISKDAHQQLSLIVKASEEFHAGELVHDSAVNMSELPNLNAPKSVANLLEKDIETGNKLTVLVGDYFFSRGFQTVSETKMPALLGAYGTMLESFITCHFNQSAHEVTVSEWENRVINKFGGNLATSFQSVALINNHSELTQKRAFSLGCSIALAFQSYHEIRSFLDVSPSNASNFDTSSLPVVLFLERNPAAAGSLFSRSGLDYSKFYMDMFCSDVVHRGKILLACYIDESCRQLEHFKTSEATTALEHILESLRTL